MRLDEAIEAFDGALAKAGDVLAQRRSEHQKLEDRVERAARERETIEGDAVLKAALKLETIDADRIGNDAVGTLEQAARAAQRIVVETRLAAADDERAALHLEEHGLLPPSPDAQRVLEFLADADRARILDVLSPDVRARVDAILDAGRRIPEEVLGPDELRSAWAQ